MGAGLLLLFALSTCASLPAQSLEQVLSRVSEEAEAFRLAAPRLLAREKLVQRVLQPPARFRPRLGNAPLEPPKPQYLTREVISEYGFASFRDAPGALHESRPAPQGHPAPVSVSHREKSGSVVTVENVFQYSDWRQR